jgi:hypothetical protein
MEGLIRFLFITIGLLYLVRAIVRWALPMLFQSVINKAQQQQQQANYKSTQQQKPNGRITVEYVPDAQKSKIPDNEGDFIDYEEVK